MQSNAEHVAAAASQSYKISIKPTSRQQLMTSACGFQARNFNRNVLAVQCQRPLFQYHFQPENNRNKEGILMAAVEVRSVHFFILLQASCD